MKKALITIGAIVVGLLAFLVVYNLMVEQSARPEKPVLYLYAPEAQRVTVTLNAQGTLDTVYPLPDNQSATDRGVSASWTVDAAPDGTLTDREGRAYPSLFWDGQMALDTPQEGLVVAREDAVPFLEAKLAQLGLNDKEAADFITYWAPRIRANEYTFVSFDASSYERYASYTFTNEAGGEFAPDTFIRVFMTIRKADANTVVTPQTFGPTPQRVGFTAVEWGGVEQ